MSLILHCQNNLYIFFYLGCINLGNHFDIKNKKHGCHDSDLDNIVADGDDIAKINVTVNGVTLLDPFWKSSSGNCADYIIYLKLVYLIVPYE